MASDSMLNDVEGFLCACLRGENTIWPYGHDGAVDASFIDLANYHGVLALLNGQLQGLKEAGHGWPAAVINAGRESAIAHVMWELRHRVLLKEVFDRLAAEKIIPVVFKGTALAYTLYPQAALRSRGDTDLIIPPETRARMAEVLDDMGFEREVSVSGESVAYEASYTRSESGEGSHTLDVHWRINNSELLSRLFTYGELLEQSQPMAELGDHARAAGPVHALLIACMHRAVHKQNPYYVNGVAYYSGDRLIWLYDIHLLTGTFSSAQWEDFVHMAKGKGLCSVCLEGFERASIAFHTVIPESVRDALGNVGKTERVGRYLESGILKQQWMDFYAIPGVARKCRFVLEAVFPPPDYMRQKYPQGGWLPWLYFRRATGGVLKRLKRTIST